MNQNARTISRKFSLMRVQIQPATNLGRGVVPTPFRGGFEVRIQLSAITPGCIKGTLKRHSSPGCNPLLEQATQHPSFPGIPLQPNSAVLSTAPSKLVYSQVVPPTNCATLDQLLCPAALEGYPTKIVANRLESFLLRNKIIDTHVQKGS